MLRIEGNVFVLNLFVKVPSDAVAPIKYVPMEVDAINQVVDRYTCRTPHFHMYSLSTEHTAQMTCVQWLKTSRAPQNISSSTRHDSSFATHDTERFFTVSILPLLCRLLLRIQICCPRIQLSIAKIHGRMRFHGIHLLHTSRRWKRAKETSYVRLQQTNFLLAGG